MGTNINNQARKYYNNIFWPAMKSELNISVLECHVLFEWYFETYLLTGMSFDITYKNYHIAIFSSFL